MPANRLEDVDLTAELNIEKCELMKTGHIMFSHPEGGHDDVFWSTALAVYAAVQSPLPRVGAVASTLSSNNTGVVKRRVNTYTYSQLPQTNIWVDDGTTFSNTGTVSADATKQYVLISVTGGLSAHDFSTLRISLFHELVSNGSKRFSKFGKKI